MAVSVVSGILFAVVSIFLLGALLSSWVKDSKKEHSDDSFLVLDLTMNLTDRPGGYGLEDLTRQALIEDSSPPQLHLLEVLKALSKAKKDPKVKGIFITGSFMPSGYGCGYQAIQELLNGLEDFRESNKPVIGFMHSPKQLDYLVYSNCDELFMDPSGTLLINGLVSEQIFLADSFEKYGVGMQIVKVGDFKGAVEPYTSTRYSEENRMQIRKLLKARWSDYLSSIAHGRSIDFLELNQSLENQFLFRPKQAVELGLVDQELPFDEMLDYLAEIGAPADEEEDGFRKIKLLDYLDRPDSSTHGIDDLPDGNSKIVLIYVEGTIVDGWGDDGLSVGGGEIAARLRKARLDEDCKAIVLRINSPGGSVAGSDAILRELRRVRREKIPVVVSMGAVAASGGYWIATECDHLFAGEQTITGSIGVFGLLPNLKDLAARFGINWDSVQTYPHSNLMSVSRPKSDSEMQVIQDYVEVLYEQFIELVSSARNLSKKEVKRIAEGRVWVGTDAREIGLIDEFGGIQDAIRKADEIAQLEGDYEVREIPEVKTPLHAIEELLDLSSIHHSQSLQTPPTGFSLLSKEIDEFLSRVETLNDPRQAYGLLPWYRRSFGFVE